MQEQDLRKTDYRALLGVLLAGAAAFAAQHCLQPVISAIGATFGLDAAHASLCVSAAMIGMALMALLLAVVAQYLPRRLCIVGSLLLAALLALGIGLSSYFGLIVALRFVQGAALGLVPVLMIAYIQERFPAERVAFAVSVYVCGTTIGGMLGRFSISVLTDAYDWQQALVLLSAVFAVMGVLVCFCLPADGARKRKVRQDAWAGLRSILQPENRGVLYVSLIAFCSMGSFYSLYNYIACVLLAPPYNYSQTLIGLLFFVQIFGTVGSLLAGRAGSFMKPAHIVGCGIALLLGGSLLSLAFSSFVKMVGIALVTMGLFVTHAAASGWCGRLCPQYKEMSVAVYIFSYYCGASVLGSVAGICYTQWQWLGVVAMSVAASLLSLLALHRAVGAQQEQQAAAVQPLS